MTKVPGIDFSSGSIGHALSAGCGMALAARMLGKDFFTFVMIGDGELQEGQVWEAALFGAHNELGRLVGIIDRNGYQLDGSVDDVIGVEPIEENGAPSAGKRTSSTAMTWPRSRPCCGH